MSSVTFVIYQTGARSNGGLVSVGEIIAHAPLDAPQVITNRASDFAADWDRHSSVSYWRMPEGGYDERQRPFARLISRAMNNVRTFFHVRRHKTGVVYANNQQALWHSAFGARLAGAKVLFTVRDGVRAGSSKRKWRLNLMLSDRFLVLSREMQEEWQALLSPLSPEAEAKLGYLYSAVDRGRFSPAPDPAAVRTRLGLPPGDTALLYAARFEEKKGQLPFIREALPRIHRARPDVVVYFVGDFAPDRDDYAAACVQAVRDLGLAESARFVGHSPAIEDWYRAADLIILASQREGLARCMIEGMACGAPVVSFAVCSAREVLEAHGAGVVVPRDDFAGFATSTVALLEDEGARHEMAVQGPRWAAELFDPDRVATGFLAIVDDLTGGGAAARRPAPNIE